MARDISQIGRMEIEAHRRFAFGVTASEPEWKEVDLAGNKGWVCDVQMGVTIDDEEGVEENVIVDVPIATVARATVNDEHIPVVLERSKQVGWTVVGRSEMLPAGYINSAVVLEDTYHRWRYNYRALRLAYIPDLDFTIETLGESVTRWNGGDVSRAQIVRAWDAFGHQVLGPEVTNPPARIQTKLSETPTRSGIARHVTVRPETLGESVARWIGGDVSRAQKTIRQIVQASL
jgi:hypothetical protein